MKRFGRFGLFVLTLIAALGAKGSDMRPLAPERIEQLAAMLPESPQGMGRPITDRAAWTAVAKDPHFKRFVAGAEKLLAKPIVEMPDDVYLDFSRTGNRSRGQKVLGDRYGRLSVLVLAECLENKGRFLPGIEEAMLAYCGDKSWTLPAHDRSLAVFEGKGMSIDLHSSNLTWKLATACYWLGDKLRPEVRRRVRQELDRRTFQPYLEAVQGKGRGAYWHAVTNNWNAVCTAGVVGAALALVEPRHDRAVYVAAAERSMERFLSGFTADGYCSEGMGYWNYGFGHFIMLSETLVQAAGGKLDLMANPRAEAAAAFALHLEILPGIYPAFADCSVTARPDKVAMAYLSRRYGWGMKDLEDKGLAEARGSTSIVELAVLGFPNTATRTPSAPKDLGPAGLRFWFSEAGILVARPAAGRNGLAVALKGGHNAEHHNHNDVGSFVVALGHSTPLLDPGGEVYTARTFSSKRYESKLLNSFGHPVPVVAGQLQRTGRDAAAKVLKTDFTDACDTMVLDLSAAYAGKSLKSLKKLQRTFIFSREGRGCLRIVDEVEFSQPESFGTALITLSPWKQIDPSHLAVGDGEEAVRVEVTSDAGAPVFQSEEIHEDRGGKALPVRLGFDLPAPVKKATVTTVVKPAGE